LLKKKQKKRNASRRSKCRKNVRSSVDDYGGRNIIGNCAIIR